MTIALSWALLALAALLLIPSTVFFLQCLFAVMPRKSRPALPHPDPRPRIVVLVPAHNEEGLIGQTVAPLLTEISNQDRVVVVADNCQDRTANVAREAGAEVIERDVPNLRGKGYALSFGFEHLANSPPDVVVFVDADCRLAPGSIRTLAEQATIANRPVQGENTLLPPKAPAPQDMISALAFLVRNSVRTRGQLRLGLPCQLGGTGMAIPWNLLTRIPATESHLAEDMLMGVKLAELGHPPMFCADARVESDMPEKSEAGRHERRRWEHGHLEVILTNLPRLILKGIATRNAYLVAMALDLAVPPLALLTIMLLGLLVVACCLGVACAVWLPAWVAATSFLMVVVGTCLGWLKFGRGLVPLRFLVTIPLYIAWKLPIYLSFALGRRQKTWDRTERDPEPPKS